MLTKEDLQAIGELLKTEREQTRKIIREELELNNRVLGTIVKIELAETNKSVKEIASIEKDNKSRIESLEEQMEQKTHRN